jgi:hypothetical protein
MSTRGGRSGRLTGGCGPGTRERRRVPGLPDRGGVVTVGVGEQAWRGQPGPLEVGRHPGGLAGQLGRVDLDQGPMGAGVPADLQARAGQRLQAGDVQQGQGRRPGRLVPAVAGTDAAADGERDRGDAPLHQLRQGRVEQVGVAVVEGQQQRPPGQAGPAVEEGQQLVWVDEPVAGPPQAVELAAEAGRGTP